MKPVHTISILAVMVIAGVAAMIWPSANDSRAPRPSTTTEEPTVEAAADRGGSELDRRIAAQRTRAERDESWIDWDNVAALYIERADEGGGLNDLGLASEALDRAFAAAEPPIGPHLRRATLDFRLHRLDDCEAMLEAVEGYAVPMPNDREAVANLRADLAFFRGDYAAARAGYERRSAASQGRDPIALFSLARLAWSTGDHARAEALLASADTAAAQQPALVSFLALARATLSRERGRSDEAVRHGTRAFTLRPTGIDTLLLLAEVRLESGSLDEASGFVTRALRVDDTPQAHEIGARIARARGDTIAEEEHRAAATRAIDALYPRFPEAIAGHALLHFLRFEDADRAIQMAEVNAEARPFGEARSRLALAYLRGGRADDARREIEAVLSTEWSTGESHAIAAEIFEASSDARASTERETAERLTPGVTERVRDMRRR